MSSQSPGASRSGQKTASGFPAERKARVEWVTIDDDQAGQRVDNFLINRLGGVPRSVVYRILRKGEVRVNRGRVKPPYKLRAGDEVRLPPVTRRNDAPERVVPGARVQRVVEKAICHEDDRMLVINKPEGMAVHGGSGLSFGLIEVLRAARPDARFLELVHRLDRDTSGLVMIARKRSALRHLQEEIRSRRVTKRYQVLVAGDWPESCTAVDHPLERYERQSGERMVRVSDSGKSALTRFRVLERFQGYTLMEAFPVTGRTHQIRVHAASQGHPVAGDDKYMDGAALKAFRSAGGERLMLHASGLELTGPDDQPLTLEARPSGAFASLLARLRKP
ncbi:RluA family pseudouridine synthase [Tamilnaduibacter salinus]|uniref:Pseudouridine synthase n=1 Tax=Tamilnaduibacter salinus TaxID=1484056 RepID=A0A2U1CVD4_9GAMM|nr:RluA family pseudouridine synthase [Tamilnaduibacter salinus]PVY75417.1 RluA family pseudouridine synthase [Tamilnaduibacter salinus]